MSDPSVDHWRSTIKKDFDLRQARKDLLSFTQYTMPEYRANWHHEVMSRRLTEFVRIRGKRMMLLMPPQNGKSELGSKRLTSCFQATRARGTLR